MKSKQVRILLFPIFLLLLAGCREDVAVPSNDIETLKNYIDLEKHEPIRVQWVYSKMGEASNRIPGPTDYSLEAELIFLPSTIDSIKEYYKLMSLSLQELQRESFKFDWLSARQKSEIDTGEFISYQPTFFAKGYHGGLIFLNDSTILLYWQTM